MEEKRQDAIPETVYLCPNPGCGETLLHFSGNKDEGGVIPPHLYCPKCLDNAYHEDGKFMCVMFDQV